jgi:hypothetical protein
LGGQSHQEHLLGLSVPPIGGTPREETRSNCRGSLHAGDFLSYDQNKPYEAGLEARSRSESAALVLLLFFM